MNAPHLPGIEASSLPSLRHPRSGFFHQSRNSDLAFLPENPSPGQRRRSVSEAVLAASLTECFLPLTRPSVNPGVGTGLPLQSCCGNRIASPNPALTTGMPRCITSSSGLELFFPERRLVMESAPL